MRTTSRRLPRGPGSPTSRTTNRGAFARTRRSTSKAIGGASSRARAKCRGTSRGGGREQERPAPLRLLVLRSVHDRDPRVGSLSGDAGDHHATVHGAAGRLRDRDPVRRSTIGALVGPLGKKEDADAGRGAQGDQRLTAGAPAALGRMSGAP